MIQLILKDYFNGLIQSIRFDLLLQLYLMDVNFKNLFIKMIKNNLVMHLVPVLFVKILFITTGVSFFGILQWIKYPINSFSAIYHVVHYIELISVISKHSPKSYNNDNTIIDCVTMITVMFFYQTIMFSMITVIDLTFSYKIYYLTQLVKFIILVLYHSFYCYNNLWQYKKIALPIRINIHEKLWPYYFGYGTLISIIYLFNKHSIIVGLYNLYLIVILSIPFLIKPNFPTEKQSYPKINLSIFSYVTEMIFSLVNYLCN